MIHIRLKSLLPAFVAAGLYAPTAIASPPAQSPAPVSVFTRTMAPQKISNTLTFPARIESRVNAMVRSESEGAVTRILKPLGSRVRRGEPVAIVQHTDPVYEFAPTKVVASVDGVVSEVHVTPGSLVNKGDQIVTLTDPSQLRVMIEVAAMDVRTIKSGMKGDLFLPTQTQPINVTVAGISPAIDPMLGTAACELHVIKAHQNRVVGGQVGRVQFQVNEHEGFLISDAALVYLGKETYVRVVRDGKAAKVPVQVGERRQGQAEILSGLNAGDVLIERASRFIGDGDEVKVESTRE